MMNFDKYIKAEGRALPVFILLDTSGSMSGQKIDTVNVALKEMIDSFKNIENPRGVINLCLVAFGDGYAKIIKNLSEITDNDVYNLSAMGDTPMGKAFDEVSRMIEDYNIVSSRSYTPTIVLISDGNPTDYDVYGKTVDEIKLWNSLNKLHSGTRSSKAIKLAMGIGDDMNLDLLKAFINNNEIPVIHAKDNSTISKFFQWVTMSVSVRSVSANPNNVTTVDPGELFDKDEVEF